MNAGLVHCAPGCGTEDYEVGHANKIPPLNPTDEFGVYQDFGCFTGWRAKIDDAKFIKALEDVNCNNFLLLWSDHFKGVVYSHPYTHKYAHGERSKEPVIYRTTSQWFLKVEDLKTKLVEGNLRRVTIHGWNFQKNF
jgi:isoleucyl-tRNA synthetase